MSRKSNLFPNYIRAKCIKVFTWIFDDWFVRCNVDRSKPPRRRRATKFNSTFKLTFDSSGKVIKYDEGSK